LADAAVGCILARLLGPRAVKKTIHFEFSQELVQQPLLYQLNRRFDVVINIRAASVTEQGGFIALELEGQEDEIKNVIAYLSERGIEVIEGLGETAV
jgi:ABC-type methionine transport system ATPase subunit